MLDKFKSMQELEKETIENEDWKIITKNRNSSVSILAIHGGGIEPATTELASIIADEGGYNYFTFEGLRSKGNKELHVTSTRYDNKDAMNLVTESNQAIAIHGCEGNESIAYVGGKDERLKSLIKEQLNHIGIKAKEAPSHISGQQDNNIVNCTTRGRGVQIELTTSLRKAFFKNNKINRKSRENQSNWDKLMCDFAKAIKSAIENIE